MQRLLQIGSLLSAGYFLALPIIFGLHFLHHEDHHSHHASDLMEGESVLIEFKASCDFCELYYENHQTHHTFSLPLLAFPEVEVLVGESQDFVETEVPLFGLRGPPSLVS